MKILMVHGTGKISGGEKVSLEIVENLQNKADFILFYPSKPNLKNITSQIIFPNKEGLFSTLKKIRETVSEAKPDIIHAQGTRAALVVKIFKMITLNKTPLIYTLHGIHYVQRNFPKNKLIYCLDRGTNKVVSALVCVGDADLEAAKKLKLISLTKLLLIKNGVTIKKTDPKSRVKARKDLEIDTKQTVVTTICRLHHQKDVKTLIEAFSLLENEHITLLVVGEGEQRKELEELANHYSIENRVKFLGYRDDIDQILNITDMFILSTHWEGLPLTILEAMAMKKPVIGSNVHGLREIIENRESGLFFEEGNPQDLAKKIIELYQDKDLREKLGNAGYSLVQKQYSISKMVDSYYALYQLTLKNEDTRSH